MVRLSLSFVLAAALILAGAALQAVAITDTSPLKFAVSALVIGLGLCGFGRSSKNGARGKLQHRAILLEGLRSAPRFLRLVFGELPRGFDEV